MKTISVLLILFFTTVQCSYGQDSLSIKRAPYLLTVLVDKKNFYEEDIKESSYIFPDKTIQLYPGETIYVEADEENGVIKNMKVVKEIAIPEKTLSITFTQSAKKKVHELMMLKIQNPFKYNLSYKAKIFLLQNKKWVDTDVIPVHAELMAFETWPDIIISIGLGGWSFETK